MKYLFILGYIVVGMACGGSVETWLLGMLGCTLVAIGAQGARSW